MERNSAIRILAAVGLVVNPERGRERQPDVRDLTQEFEFKDKELRIAGRLGEGSRLEFRYRGADGSELETTFET